MSSTVFTSTSPSQTQTLAKDLLNNKKYSEHVFALSGELGSGKTTFAQGLGRAFGVRRMLSPTYTFIRQYPLKDRTFSTLYHVDLYRLASTEDATTLGLTEILSDPSNLILIEWPEKVISLLPPHLSLHFQKISNDQRLITLNQIR